MTRKHGSPPFPLLTEGKYCNRGGRRWALLRSWLKITGIFKAAEESQGRQRLDSLSPGRSSLFLLSRFLAGFSPSPLPLLIPFHFTQALQHDHDHHPVGYPNHISLHQGGRRPLNYMKWQKLNIGWLHLRLATALSGFKSLAGVVQTNSPH